MTLSSLLTSISLIYIQFEKFWYITCSFTKIFHFRPLSHGLIEITLRMVSGKKNRKGLGLEFGLGLWSGGIFQGDFFLEPLGSFKLSYL